jgi:hypothetical protein
MPATKVNVNFIPNPRISNRNADTRVVAIVGLGPTSINVVDEPVTRGTGSIDYLAKYPGTNISVSQISDFPNVISGAPNYVLISQGGVLYNSASASANSVGGITWSGNPSSDVDIPIPGDIYYVSYQAGVPSTQFDPEEFSDKADIQSKYGPENNSTGLLTIAGTIALENGAPSVLLCQASGSSYNEANYKAAIDKLIKRDNIEDVVVVFPTNSSITRAQQETIITYAMSHVMRANSLGRERGLIYGSPSPQSAPDGINVIGDSSTPGTYIYKASSSINEDICYVVPSRVRRKDANDNYMELDANFGAVAVGGLQSSLPKRSSPMHGMRVTGIEIENEEFDDEQLQRLSNAGCLVLYSKDSIIRIYDSITTDPTSADTEEKSVKVQKRLVQRTLRNGLRNEFFQGKGTIIFPTTDTDVEAKVESLLGGLVRDREIYEYGTQDDPTTGQRKIIAKIDPSEPRKIKVSCSVRYLYALKFMDVEVSTYV